MDPVCILVRELIEIAKRSYIPVYMIAIVFEGILAILYLKMLRKA